MLKAKWDGYTFHVPDEPTKGEIERGVSQPFIGEQDILKEFFDINPDRKRVMIDVGGHIGLFAVPYSKYFDNIYSYEPHAENYEYLIKNLAENNIENVIPIQEAIMFGTDRVTIVGYEKDKFINNPRYSGMFTSVPSSEGNVFATSLDYHHLDKQIDFIKIDVEGQEMNVLKTAERILEKYKPFLQIEIKDFKFIHNQPSPKDVTNYLKSFGYKLFKKKVDYFFIAA